MQEFMVMLSEHYVRKKADLKELDKCINDIAIDGVDDMEPRHFGVTLCRAEDVYNFIPKLKKYIPKDHYLYSVFVEFADGGNFTPDHVDGKTDSDLIPYDIFAAFGISLWKIAIATCLEDMFKKSYDFARGSRARFGQFRRHSVGSIKTSFHAHFVVNYKHKVSAFTSISLLLFFADLWQIFWLDHAIALVSVRVAPFWTFP